MQNNTRFHFARHTLYPGQRMATGKPTGLLGGNQILNADFSAGASQWTMGTGWAPSGFTAVKSPGTAANLTSLSTGAEVGVTYNVFAHLTWTAGTFTIGFGGQVSGNLTASGDYSFNFTATTSGPFIVTADSLGNGAISQVSVKRIF